MKTTVDIPDDLLAEAKRCARESGRPLRALVADGIRLALADAADNGHAAEPPPAPPVPRRPLTEQEVWDRIYGKKNSRIPKKNGYKLPDRAVGQPGDPWPLAGMMWEEQLEMLYGEDS